ncbi:hypothetical protein I6I10_05865 [Corynebacterium glucuronolyticum]|nr:hypothetical protein [Corynebacterium glucuronolyticum]QQB47411.1 hypothetical protein I6I10_05865 [Corynebacterium glucuronolyticum]
MRMLVSGVRMTHMGKPAILRRVHEGQVTNKDSQFQGFGAKLNKTWLWSGYNRDAYNTLVVESKKKAPKNAARLYEIEYLPYLPDNLVSRTVDVDIWSQDELNFVKKLEGTSEILTVCDSGGTWFSEDCGRWGRGEIWQDCRSNLCILRSQDSRQLAT